MTPGRQPDPRLFVELLFEVVIHEFVAIRQQIDHLVLSQVFGIFVEVSEDYQNVLSCPCHEFIRKSDLLEREGSAWSTFISKLEPKLLPRFQPLRSSKDNYFGYQITVSGIDLPTWTPVLKLHFKRRYDVFVPAEWKDDIAVFIHRLRMDLSIEGSSGESIWCLSGRAHGVRKFSSRGVDKRTQNGEKLVLFAQEQEAIQKDQEAIQKQEEAMRDHLRIQDEAIQRQQEILKKRQETDQIQQETTATQRKQEEEGTIQNEQELLAEKKLFLSFYYELVIFELAASYGRAVSVDKVVDAFALAAEVLERNSSIMFPCSALIHSEGLQDRFRVTDFVKQHRAPWTITTAMTAAKDGSNQAKVFEFSYNNRSRTEVILPTLNGQDQREFLEAYDTTVPYSFKDDLAILVWELQNRLDFRGSGGEVSTLHGGLQGVTKFTDMDTTMRGVLEQHDQERKRRMEEQEVAHLELDRIQKQRMEQSIGDQLGKNQVQDALEIKVVEEKEEEENEEDQEEQQEALVEDSPTSKIEEQGSQSVCVEQEQHLFSGQHTHWTTTLEQEPRRVEEDVVEELEEPQSSDPETERLRLHYIKKIISRNRENFFDRRDKIFHLYYQSSREYWRFANGL